MESVVTLRLDINGQSYFASTYENTAIQISRKVSSLENLNAQSTLTKQSFRVPLQGDLIDAIGDVSDLRQAAKVNLNKQIEGSIYINDIPAFKGSFQLISIFKTFNSDKKEVELLFDGSEISLKKTLQDLSMADLLEGETIPYNTDTIYNYWQNPNFYKNNNGYLFPLIDYGQRYTTDPNGTGRVLGFGEDPIQQTDIKPAVTFKKLFEGMPFDISWDSSINDLVEDQAVLLHNNESSLCELDTSPLDYTGKMDRTSDSAYLSISQTTTERLISFNNKSVYNQDQFDLTDNEYTIPVDGSYTIRISGSVEIQNVTASAINVFSAIQIKDIGGALIQVQNVGSAIPASSTRVFNLDRTIKLPNLFKNNELQLVYRTFLLSDDHNVRWLDGLTFEVVETPALNSTSNIDVPANCPDLTAWDIFKTIIVQCNGIIERDELGGVNIVPWVEWIDSNSDVRFIDDKIDPTKEQRIRPFSIEGAKKIRLKFQEGEDLYSENYRKLQGKNYGDFEVDTGTEGTERIVEREIPFVSRPLSYLDGTGFPIIKLYDSDFETVNDAPTLIQTYFLSTNIQLYFDLEPAVTGTGLTYSVTNLPYVGHWEKSASSPFEIGGYQAKDYNFGQSLSFFRATGYPNNTLYERFWKQFIQETYSENSRQLKISIQENLPTVTGYQFNEQFYLEGSKFRLIATDNINLTSKRPYNATFMKRITIENIEIAPFYPYDVIDGVVQWKDSLTNAALNPPDGSSANQTDLEASAKAYGFFYDPVQDKANQRGIILQV